MLGRDFRRIWSSSKVGELMKREIPSASQLVYQAWVAKNRLVFEREVKELLDVC